MSEDSLQPLAPLLLEWWDTGHASWPWRDTTDPYKIWISEIMLQQTQLATVVPYYERWLTQFPTVNALADAPQAAVLKCWEGLGYYSRARNLHAAAQQIVAEYGGKLPNNRVDLQKLPGIGPYTAGAIASIAFGEAAPVVDGNVIRVLTRLADWDGDVTQSKMKKALWRLAAQLVPAERPGDYNQALMELGQLVCQPRKPACHQCVAAHLCRSFAAGTQLERPVRPPRKKVPHYDVAAGVIFRPDGRFLIAQRPADGLLGGMWEFPGGKQEAGETLPQTLIREIMEELGVLIRVERPLQPIKHAFTHFRITLYPFIAQYTVGDVQHLGIADHRWVQLDELDGYPFANTDRKIIAQLNGLQSKKA